MFVQLDQQVVWRALDKSAYTRSLHQFRSGGGKQKQQGQ
jgi:hypothetical protein